MITEALQDEEIHHSAGKDYVCPCPSSLTFAHLGASSSPINISPQITISPPGMTLVLDQLKLEQGELPSRVKYNLIIVNLGGNLTIEGTMVNIKQLLTIL